MLQGFERILPHLTPIEHLILDPAISEIMLNPDGTIWIERNGRLEQVIGIVLEDRLVRDAVENCARNLGADINQNQPILDASLPDGSRLAAILSPIVMGQTCFCIRKFNNRKYNLQELLDNETLDRSALSILRTAIGDDQHILISGGTSSGKTTTLNALTSLIPADDRIVLIEDTAELQLHQKSVVRLVTRREPPVTAQQLVRGTMRLRPDRIIVGEVRGAEAYDLLDALNSGHGGSMATIHANDPRMALSKLRSLVQRVSGAPSVPVIEQSIAEAFRLVVQLKRSKQGQRYVSEIIEILGYDMIANRIAAQSLWLNGKQNCVSCLPQQMSGKEELCGQRLI